MVEDRLRYELHFHAIVQTSVVRDSNKVTQIFQENLARFTSDPLHQLPADLPDFTGRQEELERAIALLTTATPSGEAAQEASASHVGITAITGMAGVGKSALAIHVAHQLKQDFPDAQLYVNLRGTESQPLAPLDVLAGFLRAWGMDDPSMPDELTERSQLYCSFLAGKRVLVVLDNAHDSVQIRPLLPDSSSCAVLVTSRKRLAALEEATLLDLDVLPEPEALELFQRLIGVERTQAEPEAAQQIIHLCGRSPLGIRLTGGTIRNHPQWRLEDYVLDLTQEQQRIAQQRLSHQDVRASFASSFKQLDEISARLFRLLGLLRGQNFSPTIAAALLEFEPVTAEQFVKYLVDLQLLEPASVGRYCLHDLVRLFAKEQLAIEEPTEARQAARLRAARCYMETSEIVNLALKPETRHSLAQALIEGKHQSLEAAEQSWFLGALNWFQLERMNLLAAIEWAYQAEAWDIIVPLASNLVNFFNIYADYADWERTHLLALEASRKLSDRPGEAQTLTNLGNVYALHSAWETARESYEQSIAIFGELEDRLGLAKTMGNLANVYCQQDDWEKASEFYQQSRVLFSELGDRYGEAQTLANMGIFYLKQSQEAEAGVLWQEALTKLPPNLPKFERVAEWLELIQKSNPVSEISQGSAQTSGQTGVKLWSPLELARNAFQWFRRT
ncbi:tetratricopeptide repeat protein [Allocoleopsis sp.]|uniref:tetratricopeptide repeat protein n=1 Tax=Allocoleopsis sp. TaxID=3088169 RepID=UPI002FD74F30